jgi:hypothetical protein
MMKKKLSYTIMLLLFSIITAYGQNNLAEPRRTAEEQVAFEKSVKVNPAKIAPETIADPRMGATQNQSDPVNWKPSPVQEEERPAPEINDSDHMTGADQAQNAVNRTQPEGLQPQGKTVNVREVSGSRTQPEGLKPVTVTNYRDLKGSRTQPEGEKPKR